MSVSATNRSSDTGRLDASARVTATARTTGTRYSNLMTGTALKTRPALPTLPAKGNTFTDPTFGTTILRVTDGADGTSNQTAYSYWPSFNQDTTLLMVHSDAVPFLYDFDGATFTATNRRPLFASTVPGIGAALNWQDLMWAGSDTHSVYGRADADRTRIYRYNITANTYTLIRNINTLGGFSTGELTQMSRSLDDNRFACSRIDPANGDSLGYIVYEISTDSLLLNVTDTAFDEVQIDKSGRWLVYKSGTTGKVYDLDMGTHVDLTDGSPDYMMGHSDNGTDFCVGFENWNGTWQGRKLSTPHTHSTVLDGAAVMGQWPQDGHVSLLSDDENWVHIGTDAESDTVPDLPLANELFFVRTDGSLEVRRVCHHRSRGTDYYDSVRSNVSRDGRFIAFTSTWEGTLGTGRRDFFVVRAE